jgi:adenylate cyclase
MNKEFGTSILASGAVRAAVSELFEFRALGTARAKGRMEELLVYELVGSSPGLNINLTMLDCAQPIPTGRAGSA